MAGGSRRAGIGTAGGAGTATDPWRALSTADLVGILDHLTDGILVIDESWRIRYANEPAGLMAGRQHPDLIGKFLWDEFPEAADHPFHPAAEEAMEKLLPQRLVERYGPLDRWFETRIYPQAGQLVVLFRDITEQQLTEEGLRDYVDRVTEAEHIVGFGVWKWELDSGRVRWSDELHRIYGLRPGEFGGTVEAFVERLHPDDRERVWAHIADSLETLEPFAFEERIVRPDGSVRTLFSQGRAIAGPDGSAEAMVGVCHDVTDRAEAVQALGASERRMRAIIDNTPSLITVQDLEGHCLMGNAEAERVLGVPLDELLGMHCVDAFPARFAARQLRDDRRAVREEGPVYGEATLSRDGEERCFVTVTFPLPGEDGTPAETCTIATDVTERKEREGERRDRLEWTERIGSALAEDRLLAFAQPIVDLRSGTQVARELLARLRAPGEGGEILAPEDFLPAAERHGLVQRIDVLMVRRAIGLAADGDLHVNLSAVTLSDLDARAEIAALLGSEPEAARRLVFELTETADVDKFEAATTFAAEVTALGARLALDDFGVGFGSFRYLRSLPLSLIKIDTSFVRGINVSPHDLRSVRCVIGIAREFGLKTVAEGVEDAATLESLRELGADLAQGYHLGRPAPIEP